MVFMSQTTPNVIDVVGPTFHNKGDQLMLAAICEMFEPRYRVRCLDGCESYTTRRVFIGASRKLPLFGSHLRKLYYSLADLLPRAARDRLQLSRYGEIAATIDCSGYLYGDPWDRLTLKMRWRLDHYRTIKRAGKPLIFMPQAFGPFSNPRLAERVRDLLALADVVACRDRQSLDYVQQLGLTGPRVQYVPDITVRAPATAPADEAAWAETVAIVPNLRMVDKTGPQRADAYVEFQAGLINRIVKRGLKAALVLHESFDYGIATVIAKTSGKAVDVIHRDPLQTKGIIKASKAVLSSRFHALVSALSQATPCLGTSWTHKYRELFSDYAVADCLLPVDASASAIDDQLDRILTEPSRSAIIETLRERAAWHRQEILNFTASLEPLIAAGAKSPHWISPVDHA